MKYGKITLGENSAKSAKKQGVLVRDGSFSAVTLSMRFDPQKFYQTGSGLDVWDDFKERIVPAASSVEAGVSFKKTTTWRLVNSSTGQDLLTERPQDVWSATDFCAWLSVKLAGQPNGESGELPNRGYANLFLVEGFNSSVFVVYVHWSSIYRRWRVGTWRLDIAWDAGYRFVSRPIVL